MPITHFDGTFRFLSNFHPAPIRLGGVLYPSSEHAYQAAKTLDRNQRENIADAVSPGHAKKLGRKVFLRPDWEEIKLDVMLAILRQKFSRDPLRSLLLLTGDRELVEGNYWGDTFWGQCPVGTGENHLGRLLMLVRSELRS